MADAGGPPGSPSEPAARALSRRERIEARVETAVGGGLSGLAFGLAAVVAGFAGINALRFPAPISARVVALDLAVATILAAMGWLARRRRLGVRWLEPATAAICVLASANVFLVAFWVRDPFHLVVALPAPVVAAVGLYSWPALAATAALFVAGWFLVATAIAAPPQLSFALLASLVVSAIVLQLRRQAIGRIERLLDRLRASEAHLRSQERLTRLFLRDTPVSVLMVDREIRILAVSERWMNEFLPNGPDPCGRIFYEIFPTTPERWKAMHQRCLAGAVERCDEDPLVLPDGQRQWLRWEVRPWYEEEGAIGGLVCFSEYVTDRKQMREALERLARYDPLTGALNRGAMTDELDRRWRRFESTGDAAFAVLFFDLDGFKAVNDRYGHAAGDCILSEIGNRFAASLRPTDSVGRFGGDEFVVALHEVATCEVAEGIAGKLQERLARVVEVGDERLSVAVSAGVALASEAASLEALLDLADSRMYAAKRPTPRAVPVDPGVARRP